MRPEKRAALQLLENLVSGLLELEPTTDEIERFVARHNGRMADRAGTHEVRLAGVAGTATMGWPQALESWLRVAKRKLGD